MLDTLHLPLLERLNTDEIDGISCTYGGKTICGPRHKEDNIEMDAFN
jgi:hypothetical protein